MFQAAYTRLWAFRTPTRIALTSHIRDNAGFFVVQRRREAPAKIPLRQQADSLERKPFRPQGHGEESVPSLSSMFLLLRAGYELVESSTRLYGSVELCRSGLICWANAPCVIGFRSVQVEANSNRKSSFLRLVGSVATLEARSWSLGFWA